jgi:hypothetical protein
VTSRAPTAVFEVLHLDLMGPKTPALGGFSYILMVVDAYSRFKWIFPLRGKRILESLQQFWSEVIRSSKVEAVRCDGGGEFINAEVGSFFRKRGVFMEVTGADTPQHNAKVERALVLVMRTALMMLDDSGFDEKLRALLWVEAVRYATYLANYSPHRGLDGRTPVEVFRTRFPKVKARLFGSTSFILRANRSRYNLESIGEEAIFVGVNKDNPRQGRFYKLSTRRIIQTEDFRIHEGAYRSTSTQKEVPSSADLLWM